MKKYSVKSMSLLGLAAVTMTVATPAVAQQVSVDVPVSINVVRPLQLFVDRPLQFGPVAPSATSGIVKMMPDAAGTRSVLSGNVTLLPPTAGMPVTSGIVRALGELNAAVNFTVTMPTTLSNVATGTTIGFSYADDRVATPVLNTPAAGGLGSYSFYVSGNVSLAGGEPSGLYQNVIPVTASYN